MGFCIERVVHMILSTRKGSFLNKVYFLGLCCGTILPYHSELFCLFGAHSHSKKMTKRWQICQLSVIMRVYFKNISTHLEVSLCLVLEREKTSFCSNVLVTLNCLIFSSWKRSCKMSKWSTVARPIIDSLWLIEVSRAFFRTCELNFDLNTIWTLTKRAILVMLRFVFGWKPELSDFPTKQHRDVPRRYFSMLFNQTTVAEVLCYCSHC